MTLYLASASPRRVELLRQIGLDPRVLPSRVPEARQRGETPQAMVLRLAKAKASEVADRLKEAFEARQKKMPGTSGQALVALRGVVLAADTTVAVGRHVLEKPQDAAHATAMLKKLSGKAHIVHTGVCLQPLDGGKAVAFVEATKVFFRKLNAAEIAAYVSTGEPLDKAGGYGIQGAAAAFVGRIEGDYFTVVGLPLARVADSLQKMGA
jgi:septum formation protein